MKTQTTLPEWIKTGARFRLMKMEDDPDPMPPGSTGTITQVVALGCIGERGRYQLWVNWDGVRRGLMVLWPEDEIEPL